jgi:5'(3')-deoxyribonucleotidase/uncharacterized protein with PQ loop repeat
MNSSQISFQGVRMGLADWVGSLAAACTTFSFVPQIVKIKRQGGRDLSFPMLFIYLSGCLLWLAYGLVLHAQAIIWANSATSTLVTIAIIMKATHPDRRISHQIVAPSASSAGFAAERAPKPEPVSARYLDRELADAGPRRASKSPGSARKLRVAVDMDEVIADAFGKMLRAYNERTGRAVTKEQIAREGIEVMFAPEFLTPELKTALDNLPNDRTFFADLELVEGSQQALRDLSQDFEIFIASAAMDVPSSFDAKYQWLLQYFPFIPASHYVFCGDKGILDADFLVDDRPRHFHSFRGTGILFTAPHNVNRPAKLRADNWRDVVRILQEANIARQSAAIRWGAR